MVLIQEEEMMRNQQAGLFQPVPGDHNGPTLNSKNIPKFNEHFLNNGKGSQGIQSKNDSPPNLNPNCIKMNENFMDSEIKKGSYRSNSGDRQDQIKQSLIS